MNNRVVSEKTATPSAALPQHIAVIMDGNGRWAKRRHLPRVAGHKAGLEAVRAIVRGCAQQGVKILTLFAFSSENWLRAPEEVSALMHLFITALRREIAQLHKNNVRLRFIGNLSRLNPELQTAMQHAVQLTENNKGLMVVVAVDYGGKWDIVQTTQKLVAQALSGQLQPEDITEHYFEQALSTQELPPPDLFIRTSGEQRISNFLLWQLAYTELYFTDVYWPDFNEQCLLDALQFYANRERRFGKAEATLDSVEVAHA